MDPKPQFAADVGRGPGEHLFRKLSRRDRVSEREREALRSLLEPERIYAAGEEIVRPGVPLDRSTLLLAGFAGRVSFTRDGGRQFTELHLPGDFLDLHSLLMKTLEHGVVAISDCVTTSARHEDLRKLTEAQPHLTRLLWLETVIDAAIHRQWLVGLGRRDALGRLGHFICEMGYRLELAGYATRDRFRFPLTQTDVADVLGITPVHVNRTVRVFRDMGLVTWKDGAVRVDDFNALADLCEFDATYLRPHSAPV